MHCKSLWIKVSAKCINVNVKVSFFISLALNKGMFAKTVVAQTYMENVPPAATDYLVAWLLFIKFFTSLIDLNNS